MDAIWRIDFSAYLKQRKCVISLKINACASFGGGLVVKATPTFVHERPQALENIKIATDPAKYLNISNLK